jgi:hypothetical protein
MRSRDDRSVADSDGGVRVDGRDDPGYLGDGQRVRLSTRRDAHDPTEPTTNTSYDEVGGRVGQALLMMAVGDAGAVPIESPEGETGLGAR